MARAVLVIDADTSGLSRALGDLRRQSRSTQAAISADARRGSGERTRTAQGEKTQSDRLARDSVQAKRRAEGEKTQATETEAAKRADKEKKSLADIDAAERKRTREHDREERRRTNATEREERRRTAAATREYRQRRQAWERSRERDSDRTSSFASNAAGRIASGIGSSVSTMHDQIQSARRERAMQEHTLNGAFYQAHIGGAEARSYRSTLQEEVANGRLRGLTMDQVGAALSESQTQFNVLGGQTESERRASFGNTLNLMEFARNTYQDPTEVLRISGMLNQQNIRGADQMSIIRAMTGMAQTGSIELSTLTSTALGPLMQNIARSVNSNMTPVQRQEAVRNATLETMAVGEVASRANPSSRDSLNALSKVRESIASPRRMQDLYNRLTGEQGGTEGRTLATRMFNVQNGRATLKNNSAIGFMSDLVQGFGGDANRVSSILGAGGPGAPMVLDSQSRRLVTLLASQGEGGRSIAQNVQTMMAEGGRFGDADIQRGREMRSGEDLTTLNATETARINALTDNTKSIVNLSNNFANWSGRNPLGMEGAKGIGGAVTDILGTKGTAAAAVTGGVLAAVGANAYATITGRTVGGENVSTAERLQRGGSLFSAAMLASQGPLGMLSAAITGGGMGAVDIATLIGNKVAEAIRANPPTATVEPHAAAVATANAGGTRPVPGRRS